VVAVGEAAKADPRFVAALKKRGITDLDKVQVDPWSAGNYGRADEVGKRISHTFCWYRSEAKDNGYAHPIEGLNAVVDLNSRTVLRVDDHGAAPVPIWTRIIRPRTILYTTLWSLIGVAMVVALFMRDSIGMTIAHDRNPLFVTLSDGSIRNAYTVKIENMNAMPHRFRISAKSDPELRLDIQGLSGTDFEIGADAAERLRIFLLARPWFDMPERTPVRIWVEDLTTLERTYYDTHFQGPSK